MFNKIIAENPLRKRLRLATVVLVIWLAALVVCLILVNATKQNFDGNTRQIEGVVEKVSQSDDTFFLHLVGDNEKYCATHVVNAYDFSTLKGKTVTLWVPENQKIVDPPLVLGFAVENVLVVNAQDTISRELEETHENVTVLFVVCAVLGVAVCAVTVWQINVAKTKEFSLAQRYVEFFAQEQPLCKQYKKLAIFVWIWLAAFFALLLAAAVVDVTQQNGALYLALCVALCTVLVLGVAALVVALRVLKKLNVAFYCENFPFDFTDLSHARMKKSVKAELQAKLKEERETHPHRYGDGGNGLWAEFGKTGVKLSEPSFETDASLPEAEEVFSSGDSLVQDKSLVAELSYAQLNFEAVALFNVVHRPLFVVVKSRLEPIAALPDNNDLHFILDSNLLATLKTFEVPVENLEDILHNKEQILQEHCLKTHKKR